MKILLTFLTKGEKFPLDYRRVFLSFFKKSLSSVADGKYFEKYYGCYKRRPFTFTVSLKSPDFSGEYIRLGDNRVRLGFSTGDSLTGFVFMSAFINMKDKPFPLEGGNSMVLKSVNTAKDKTVQGNSALIKMLSPLCVRQHDSALNRDAYYSVASEDFAEKCHEVISEQLISEGFSKELAESAELIPVNCKKTVVKHYGCYIECSIGEFAVNADKAVINYFLQYGVGSRKSSGFGFAELIAEA